MVLVLLAGLSAPLVVRSRKKTDLVEAINNARQIGLALTEFETSYGSFPDALTAKEVQANTLAKLDLSGTSSNAAFRQLIAAEIALAESMFYARCSARRRPDNDFSPSRALEKGEVGYSYIAGIPARRPPDTPIVMTPLLPGKASFDTKNASRFLYGKAVLLRTDNSVISKAVPPSGTVHVDGKNLLDPSHRFWSGRKPDLRWPE